MRSLSESEARVIEHLLAASFGGEVDRERRSGIPRTTFQTIRRRALSEGWVQERYVPAPLGVGASALAFRLIQPFAEHRAEVVRRLRLDPRVVLLWASPETVFAVTFDGVPCLDARARDSDDLDPGDRSLVRRAWSFVTPPDGAAIPVYFDYEGAWSRRIGLGAPVSYPQALPAPTSAASVPKPTDLASVLTFPFQSVSGNGGMLRFSPSHLSRGSRRLLEVGWAAHRVFPNLAEIPPYNGARDERVVFVLARTREPGALGRLLRKLFQQRRIAPFLAVAADGGVLLAMLSPAPPRTSAADGPVLPLFEEELREIEILREPIATLFPIVDHRYDCLVSEGPR